MKTNIKLQISIPSQTRYLSLIGRISENLTKEVFQPQYNREKIAQEINTVLTEAIVNTIKHDCKSALDGDIRISISIEENELLIRFFDSGKGFDINSIPKLNFDNDLFEECGRGIHIIRTLMDSVVYRKMVNGYLLEMKKMLV